MSMEAVDFADAIEQARFADPPGSRRATVAACKTYTKAKEAINHLGDADFPIERAAIVARGVRYVEEVTGRWRVASAAWHGMLSGAVVGALFGFVFGLFSLIEPLVSGLVVALYGLVFGAAVGFLLGLVGFAYRGRDFRSVGNLDAAHFDVCVDPELAERARALLRRGRVSSVKS